jgi:hypothetical protein
VSIKTKHLTSKQYLHKIITLDDVTFDGVQNQGNTLWHPYTSKIYFQKGTKQLQSSDIKGLANMFWDSFTSTSGYVIMSNVKSICYYERSIDNNNNRIIAIHEYDVELGLGNTIMLPGDYEAYLLNHCILLGYYKGDDYAGYVTIMDQVVAYEGSNKLIQWMKKNEKLCVTFSGKVSTTNRSIVLSDIVIQWNCSEVEYNNIDTHKSNRFVGECKTTDVQSIHAMINTVRISGGISIKATMSGMISNSTVRNTHNSYASSFPVRDELVLISKDSDTQNLIAHIRGNYLIGNYNNCPFYAKLIE